MTDWRMWIGGAAVVAGLILFVYVAVAVVTHVVRLFRLSDAARARRRYDTRIADAQRKLEERRHAAIDAYLKH